MKCCHLDFILKAIERYCVGGVFFSGAGRDLHHQKLPQSSKWRMNGLECGKM